jgi:hypothetical protein
MSKSQILFDKKAVKMTAFGRDVTVTNNVRNELNGLRTSSEVVFSTTQSGANGKPYYPRQFPAGQWYITDVVAHDKKKADGTPAEPYLYPFFLATNAHQTVPVYKLEIVNDKQKIGAPDGTAEDWGYGLHHSTSSTTLGCIKIVKEEDLRWLVDQIKAAWNNNQIVRMEVV